MAESGKGWRSLEDKSKRPYKTWHKENYKEDMEEGHLKHGYQDGNKDAETRVFTKKIETDDGAMLRTDVASLEGNAGPLHGKVGFGLDTGAKAGPAGVELKVAGCGFDFGRRMGISLFGNEIGFSLD